MSDFFKYTIKEKGYIPAQARTWVRNPQEGSSWEDKIWAVRSSYPPTTGNILLGQPRFIFKINGLFFHLGRCTCFTTDCEISPHQWGYFSTSSANWSSKLSWFFTEVQAAAKAGSLILGLLNLIYKRYNEYYKKIFLSMLSDLGLKVGILTTYLSAPLKIPLGRWRLWWVGDPSFYMLLDWISPSAYGLCCWPKSWLSLPIEAK